MVFGSLAGMLGSRRAKPQHVYNWLAHPQPLAGQRTGCLAIQACKRRTLTSTPWQRHSLAGKLEGHHVEPADAPRAAGGGAVLGANLAQLIRQLAEDLGGVRPRAHTRGVGLGLQGGKGGVDGGSWE